MEAPDFWDDPEKSQSKMKELKSMKDDVATYAKLKEQYEDIETMIEMGYEENDESLIPEIQQMLDDFESTYDGIRMKTLLSGEYDKSKKLAVSHGRRPQIIKENRNPLFLFQYIKTQKENQY